MRYFCRLCSTTDKIIDVYHSQLESGEQLRHYILLASGIEILWNDPISRMVCHRCCEIAVKLHKYRSNAVANDKLLKEKYGQPYTAPITDKDELLSAASRMFNLTEIGIMKDDADPLELLNTYISSKSARNGKATVTKLNVENVSKTEESVTIKPPTLSSLNLTRENTLDNVKDKTRSALENDKAAVPLNNATKDVPKPQSAVKCDIAKAIRSRSITPNADTDVDKSNTINSRDDKGISRLSQPDVPTYAHDSVKQLFKEYHSIQLPKEVFSSDVSPRISIDPTEVSDWYSQQLQNLTDKLKNIASSNSNPLSSSDDDDLSRPRLRKRKHKRIIDCSDSDGDDEWLPFKIQAQDVKSTKPTRLVISNSNATARISETSQIPNCSNVTSDSNYTVVNRSNSPKQPVGGGLKLKIMKQLPPPTATNTGSNEFLATEPNTRVLQSLLTSNDQTLANLYTDFSKYGINIENSEPPILYENEGASTSSLTDMVLEAMAAQKPEAIKSVEATVNVTKVNDDIICISDDENDTVDEKTTANSASFINSNEEKMINLLLKKHLNHRLAKESQTFHPNDSIIHRTKTNLIALPNMVGELRRYKIPIDLKYSAGNIAHFENNINHNSQPTLDKWSMEECMNISIVKSTPPCTTQTATVLNNGLATNARNAKPPGSLLWNQMFVDRITNAIKNKCNNISSNLEKSSQVPPNLVKSNQQVTPNTGQLSHITSNLFGNVIRDKNVNSVNSPCVDTEVNRQKPIILNGSNSLSLHSLLYSEKTIVDRSPEPAVGNKKSTASPLLQNYLQANTVSSDGLLPPKELNSENLTATVIQPVKDIPQVEMTSKIRVKNMSELL